MNIHAKRPLWAAIAGILTVAGFAVPASVGAQQPRPQPGESPPQMALSDPQIAHVVTTANDIDIQMGRLAASQSTNPEVQQFGRRMVAEHSALNQQATDLVGRLGVTPQSNEVSSTMRSDAESVTTRLKSLSGDDFDRDYIDHELEFHQTVLDMIDNTLLPNARNTELKNLLQGARPVIQAHLDEAQRLQATLIESEPGEEENGE